MPGDIKCFSCQQEIGEKCDLYQKLRKANVPQDQAIDELGFDRRCCRNMLEEHAGLIEILMGNTEPNPQALQAINALTEPTKQQPLTTELESSGYHKEEEEEEEGPVERDFVESVRSYSEEHNNTSKQVDTAEEDPPKPRKEFRASKEEKQLEGYEPRRGHYEEPIRRPRKSDRKRNGRPRKSSPKSTTSSRSLHWIGRGGETTVGGTVISGAGRVIANPHAEESTKPIYTDDGSLIKHREDTTKFTCSEDESTASCSTETSESFYDDNDEDWALTTKYSEDGTWIFKPAPSERYSFLCCLPGEMY